MNCNPITMVVSLLAACLLVPAIMLMAADWVVSRASTPEDKRYHAELWRIWLNSALYNLGLWYVLTAITFSIVVNTRNMVQTQLLLDLAFIVWFILCYRGMANLRDSLVPDTEFKPYASKSAALKLRLYAYISVSLVLVMALSGVIIDSYDDHMLLMLAAIGGLVAIGGFLSIIVVRYCSRIFDRILPESEMEILMTKRAEAERLLNQHLPEGHIPVKLELMEFMIGYADSMQRVCVEMRAEKRVSVSILGLKMLDQNELLFLSLSGAFTGLSNKSQIAADQRALAITEDRHTVISALKKELATAFKEVRFLQKRIKALEVI